MHLAHLYVARASLSALPVNEMPDIDHLHAMVRTKLVVTKALTSVF